MMAQRRPLAWLPILGAIGMGAAAAGVFAWHVNLQGITRQIQGTRSSLKKLSLSGGISPNEELMREYLTWRRTSLSLRYSRGMALVASPPLSEAARVDPQLYFQQQFHEVQRTLERLATARSMAAPEQLGFPKELPPSDTVQRLLIQLSLIKEAAALIFEQGVAALASFKIEDPQTVPQPEGEEPFLIRLPVRVRLNASLPQLMKVLGAIQRANPLIDALAIRIAPASSEAAAPERLEVELLLSRYLVTDETQEPLGEDEEAADTSRRSANGRTRGSPASKAGPSTRPTKPTKPTRSDE